MVARMKSLLRSASHCREFSSMTQCSLKMLLSSALLSKESFKALLNIFHKFLPLFVNYTQIKQLLLPYWCCEFGKLCYRAALRVRGGGTVERGALLLPLHTNERKLQTCFWKMLPMPHTSRVVGGAHITSEGLKSQLELVNGSLKRFSKKRKTTTTVCKRTVWMCLNCCFMVFYPCWRSNTQRNRVLKWKQRSCNKRGGEFCHLWSMQESFI